MTLSVFSHVKHEFEIEVDVGKEVLTEEPPPDHPVWTERALARWRPMLQARGEQAVLCFCSSRATSTAFTPPALPSTQISSQSTARVKGMCRLQLGTTMS